MKKKLHCVLLIDDDHVTNFLNQKVIEKAGIAEHIEVKLNGQEALDFLNNQSASVPPLILLDINMPIMDGWEFIEAYCSHATLATRQTNIIMLSTSSNPDDKKRAENQSMIAAFKSKPLTFEVLDEIMKTHFEDYTN